MTAGKPVAPEKLRRTIELAQERRRARPTRYKQWEYLQFLGKCRFLPGGSTVFGDEVIWGYPKIGRILQLSTGIPAQFDGPFWVEEKIDGYNVRIIRQGEDFLVLTRRGYVCPFSSDRLSDLMATRILQDHPELVICAEIAGPDNPYNEGCPPFIEQDVRLFVFDIMRRNRPGCLRQADKQRLIEAYDLPAVPGYGRFEQHALPRLCELMLKLDRSGREGIVMKEDSPRDRRIKYVTGSSSISDIGVNKRHVQQLPAEYYTHRILRMALFLEEHGLPATPEIQRSLGAALTDGILDAVALFREQGTVYHTFRCRFRQQANAELMMRTLKRRLGGNQVKKRRLVKQDDYYLLEFDKIMPRTTGVLQNLLQGGVVFD